MKLSLIAIGQVGLVALALSTTACFGLMPPPQPQPAGDPNASNASSPGTSPGGASTDPSDDPAAGSTDGPGTRRMGSGGGTGRGGPPRGGGDSDRGSKPRAFVPTMVELHSDCPKTIPIFIGEKPKFGSGTRSSISSNTTTSVGRKADGTVTIWIIDQSENGVANARVSPDTRRVTIDRSCKDITAS